MANFDLSNNRLNKEAFAEKFDEYSELAIIDDENDIDDARECAVNGCGCARMRSERMRWSVS